LKIKRFSEPQKRLSNSPEPEVKNEEYITSPIYLITSGTMIP
jgi:hypothetical protein